MIMAYFVDASPAKLGKYVPRNGTPVLSRKEAENSLPYVFFILMPNYAKHFKKVKQSSPIRVGDSSFQKPN